MKLEYFPAMDLIIYNEKRITGHALRALLEAAPGDFLEVGHTKDRVTVIGITHGATAGRPLLRGRIVTTKKRVRSLHHPFHPKEILMTTIRLTWSNPTVRSDSPPTALPDGAITAVQIVRTPADGSAPVLVTLNTPAGGPAPTTYDDVGVADGTYDWQAFAVTAGGTGEGSNVFNAVLGIPSGPPAETIPPGPITDLAGVAIPDPIA